LLDGQHIGAECLAISKLGGAITALRIQKSSKLAAPCL
jgi:hypothetical protein